MGLSTGNAAFLPGVQLKAWALITPAGAILRSFNVSSVVKQSTGTYQVTFTVAMTSTSYLIRYTNSAQGAVQGPAGLTTAFANVASQVSGVSTDGGGLWEFYE